MSAAKIKNLDKKPNRGGIPANDKNNTTIVVLIKPVERKNLYSFKVLNTRKSNKKKMEKKKANKVL
jgi:hypothetical protein